MPSNHSLPVCVEPFHRKNSDSIGSAWLTSSDVGDCYVSSTDSHLFPCLTLVYNGQILDIKSELIHASLAGISMKHYYGKCYNYVEESEIDYEEEYDGPENPYEYELFDSTQKMSSKSSGKLSEKFFYEYSSDASKDEMMENFEVPVAMPFCVRLKINYRNSFWNLHKPELCKLTWPQKYVSAVTVTEHLHDHLMSHGDLCADYHEEKDRIDMLNKELDEYGRLKMLASPRDIPPDEKPFDLRPDIGFSENRKPRSDGPRCKSFAMRKPQEPKFIQISDDDEDTRNEGKMVRRSKEEFCLTIGKHVRKPAIKKTISEVDEFVGRPDIYYSPEEEDGFLFFDWLQINAEEYFGEKDTDESTVDLEPVPLNEPCNVLAMDDFCRAVAKADFSDLRCNPDDF